MYRQQKLGEKMIRRSSFQNEFFAWDLKKSSCWKTDDFLYKISNNFPNRYKAELSNMQTISYCFNDVKKSLVFLRISS